MSLITPFQGAIHDNDFITILEAELKKNGPEGHHLNSYNNYIKKGIPQIITNLFKIDNSFISQREATEEDRSIGEIQFKVEFYNVIVNPPSERDANSRLIPTYPYNCKKNDKGYYSSVFATVKIMVTAVSKAENKAIRTVEETIPDVHITNLPTMVGSELCSTYGQPPSTLQILREDPNGVKGSFIIGGEWFINTLENLPMNKPQFHIVHHHGERTRGMFISKPGDTYENSNQIQVRRMENGAITVELTHDKFSDKLIPWFIFMRLLGISDDRDMFNMVTFGGTDQTSITIINMLSRSMNAITNEYQQFAHISSQQSLLLEMIFFLDPKINVDVVKKNDNMMRHWTNFILDVLDKHLLPHLGQHKNDRYKKARFIGDLIRRLCLVDSGLIPPSKRDLIENKRYHPAGPCLAKATKTVFNKTVVKQIKEEISEAYKTTSFSDVNLREVGKKAFKPAQFLALIKKTINTGDDEVIIDKNNTFKTHMSTQLFHAKNHLNLFSIARTIATASSNATRQKERADEMRRVGSDFAGYIDPVQSADSGPKVGLEKQMACSCSITESTSSQIIKNWVAADKSFIPLDKFKSEDIYIATSDPNIFLGRVMVNGDWIGFVTQSIDFVRRFRETRRLGNGGINIETSININIMNMTRDIEIWCDLGRLKRPLMIVYSNVQEHYESLIKSKTDSKVDVIPFRQWTRLTEQHIHDLRSNKSTIDDLVLEGVIEYITSEESNDCLIADSPATLIKENTNPLLQYSHCDIPQAVAGWVTLAVPFANHANTVRDTMAGNHRRQSCGWFALNWPFRTEKKTFHQTNCERSLCSTMADRITNPNGHNALVALMVHTSKNDEDSVMLNSDSIERGMFRGSAFDYEETKFLRDDQAGPINQMTTMDVKRNANFSKTENGFVKIGSFVERHDVLICKSSLAENPQENLTRVDRSVMFSHDEPAFVWKVESDLLNDSDERIAKIALRSPRPAGPGDKFSSRTGNKGIASCALRQFIMPYSENGLIPDLIVNPHSVPTRMAVNQVIEGVVNLLCCKEGFIADTTIFFAIQIEDILSSLEAAYGFQYDGYCRMYNGETSEPIETLIFLTPQGYQRLLKFAIEDSYAVDMGSVQKLTGQPQDGRHLNGGLRDGEMDGDCRKGAHGAQRTYDEKTRDHSDGIKLFICRRCGNRSTFNHEIGLLKCRHCRELADIYSIESAQVTNLFMHEISAMGIDMLLELKSFQYVSDDGESTPYTIDAFETIEDIDT